MNGLQKISKNKIVLCVYFAKFVNYESQHVDKSVAKFKSSNTEVHRSSSTTPSPSNTAAASRSSLSLPGATLPQKAHHGVAVLAHGDEDQDARRGTGASDDLVGSGWAALG